MALRLDRLVRTVVGEVFVVRELRARVVLVRISLLYFFVCRWRRGIRVIALRRLLSVRVYFDVVTWFWGCCCIRRLLVVVVHLVLVQSCSHWVVCSVATQLRHVVCMPFRGSRNLDASSIRLRSTHNAQRGLIIEFASSLRILLQNLLLVFVAYAWWVKLHVAWRSCAHHRLRNGGISGRLTCVGNHTVCTAM